MQLHGILTLLLAQNRHATLRKKMSTEQLAARVETPTAPRPRIGERLRKWWSRLIPARANRSSPQSKCVT